MVNRFVLFLAIMSMGTPWRPAVAQDAGASYESLLLSKVALTQVTSDKSSIAAPGTVLVLQKDNLGLWSTTNRRLYFPINTYSNGGISPEFPTILRRESDKGNARIFATGDKLWLTKVLYESNGRGVDLQLLSEPYKGTRFAGTLRFPFPKGQQPTPDQFLQMVSDTLQTENGPLTGSSAVAATPGGQTSDSQIASSTPAGAGAAHTDAVTDATVTGSSVSVAGVRLGMTPDEAIEALKTYDTWGYLKKRYSEGPHAPAIEGRVGMVRYEGVSEGSYGLLGMSEDCRTQGGKPFPRPPLLVAIIAAKASRAYPVPAVNLRTPDMPAPMSDCSWQGSARGAKPGDDPEEVIVYLSPTPGHERVIGVSLWRSFAKETATDAVIAAAQKRYPFEVSSTKKLIPSNIFLSWRFDARNRLMSQEAAERAGVSRASFSDHAELPASISEGRRVGLDFFVYLNGRQPEFAKFYTITLFNEKDVFDFTQQAYEAQAVIDQQAKQQRIDKAKQNTVEIK